MPGIQNAIRMPRMSGPPKSNGSHSVKSAPLPTLNQVTSPSIIGRATTGPNPWDDCSRPIPMPRCRRNQEVTATVSGTWNMPIDALNTTPKNRNRCQISVINPVSIIPTMYSIAPTVIVNRAP